LNMTKAETYRKKEKGYVLVVVIFIMLLLMTTVVALNRRAGLQAKIAANQIRSVQTQFGQLAAIENAAWQLQRNPQWRTNVSGEDYEFDGIVYNRKIFDSTRTCSQDVIMVSITGPAGKQPATAGLRIRFVHEDTLYIADTENDKIKKVDRTGRIRTVPTPNLDKPRGVAVSAAGNIFISDTKNNRIIMVDTSGNQWVLGVGYLDEPHGLFVRNGSKTKLFIADTDNNRIRTVLFLDYYAYIWTISAGFLREPNGIAVGCRGNLYIADTKNHRIKVVDKAGNISILDTGSLDTPCDVAVDERGNVYVSDKERDRVIKVDDKGAITTIVDSLDDPRGVVVGASGNIYIADSDDHCVRMVDPEGVVSTVAGQCGDDGDTEDGLLAINAKLHRPYAVAVYSQATSTVAGLEWVSEFY